MVIGEQPHGRPSRKRYLIGAYPVVPVGGKVDGFAIPGPGRHQVGGIIEGQLANGAAFQRENKYVGISILNAAEREPFPIRRDSGEAFIAFHSSYPRGLPALGGNFPDVAGIGEVKGSAIWGQGRMIGKMGLFSGLAKNRDYSPKKEEKTKQGTVFHGLKVDSGWQKKVLIS